MQLYSADFFIQRVNRRVLAVSCSNLRSQKLLLSYKHSESVVFGYHVIVDLHRRFPFKTPICVFSFSKIRPLSVRSFFFSSLHFYLNECSRCLSFTVTLFDTCSQTIFSLHLFVKPVTILHVSSYLSHGCRLVDVLRIDLDTLAGPFILSH